VTTNWKLGLSFALITVVMWGLLPLGLKGVLDSMDPITVSWYRYSISAVIALLFYGYRSGPELKRMFSVRFRLLSLVAALGLLGNYVFYIFGLHFTNAGAAQILIQIAPLFLLLASVALFKESFSSRQWLGVVAFTLGLLMFFSHRITASAPSEESYLLGLFLLLCASLTWTGYGLAQKQLLTDFHAKDILLLICLGGSLLLFPFAEPRQALQLDRIEIGLLFFCGMNTIVAYGAFGLALSHWEASRVSAIIPMAPLLTLLFTWAINGLTDWDIASEPLGWIGIAGALFVVLGSGLAALPEKSPEIGETPGK
jgi:drug/metabolite transporter (DMT)-like permease